MSELERALGALGAGARRSGDPGSGDGRARPSSSRARRVGVERRRWIVAVAVVVLAALAATLAIPDARATLFRCLSIGGERIELVDELPEVPVQDDIALTLGDDVTLEEARQASSFRLRELDESSGPRVPGRSGNGLVPVRIPRCILGCSLPSRAFTCRTTRDTPEEADVACDPGRAGDVGGSPGVFLSGNAHFLFLVDEYGVVVEDSARLARDVLIWERDGVGYRLEGDLELDEALRIAASLE